MGEGSGPALPVENLQQPRRLLITATMAKTELQRASLNNNQCTQEAADFLCPSDYLSTQPRLYL